MESITTNFALTPYYKYLQSNPDYKEIVIGGLGNIGSHLIIPLTKVGFEPIVFDKDQLEIRNIGSQAYKLEDAVNKVSKVQAAKEIAEVFSNSNIEVIEDWYDGSIGSFTISAFDNMSARRQMFLAFKEHVKLVQDKSLFTFIDCRLTVNSFKVFVINGNDEDGMQWYHDYTLFHDSEQVEAVCGVKQSYPIAMFLSGYVVQLLQNILTNKAEDLEINSVPYYTYYSESKLSFNYDKESFFPKKVDQTKWN